MKGYQKWIFFVSLLALNLIVYFLSSNQDWVESVYSIQVFPKISLLFRRVFAYFPFSAGDLFYGLLVFYFGRSLVKILIKIRVLNKKDKLMIIKSIAISILNYALLFNLLFNLIWGLNYNRRGIAHQLGMQLTKNNTYSLIEINEQLLKKVNSTRLAIHNLNVFLSSSGKDEAVRAYNKISKEYHFLYYDKVCVKSSIWSSGLNYMGISGYYNPFTGEAQINNKVPGFLQPFITCHEIAHQLGYAKESEANFVGYLVARSSADTLLQYSAYLEMFLYANHSLYKVDSSAAKNFRNALSIGVKNDLEVWRKFNQSHQSFIEPLTSWFYDKFLKTKNQPEGMRSYNEVIAYIAAYYKKYGTI